MKSFFNGIREAKYWLCSIHLEDAFALLLFTTCPLSTNYSLPDRNR